MNWEMERAQYLAAAVLVHLDQQANDIVLPDLFVSQFEIISELGESYKLSNDKEISRIFELLEQEGYVHGYHNKYAKTRYEISDEGRQAIFEASDDKKSLIYQYKKLGMHWLAEVLDGILSGNLSPKSVEDHSARGPLRRTLEANIESTSERSTVTGVTYDTLDDVPDFDSLADVDQLAEVRRLSTIGIPASNRVVSLDHNSAAYQQTIKSIDDVIREFKADHSRDNELGQEKKAILAALEAGRRLLDDTKVQVESGIALLVTPLKLVAKRYESELVGALAAGAITTVLALFGIL